MLLHIVSINTQYRCLSVVQVLAHIFQDFSSPSIGSYVTAKSNIFGAFSNYCDVYVVSIRNKIDTGNNVPIMRRHSMLSDDIAKGFVRSPKRKASVTESYFCRGIDVIDCLIAEDFPKSQKTLLLVFVS